jgi:hypothetical protein
MCSHRYGHNLLQTSVAALLMATSAHARPELSKQNHGSSHWGLGAWLTTLAMTEHTRDEELSCRYSSGKARFDNTNTASTKTVRVWVFHIVAACMRKPSEGVVRKYTHSFDMYVSKGTLWIENLRSDKKP